MVFSIFLLVAIVAGATGSDCGFTLTPENTLVADASVTAICLGPCPPLLTPETTTVGLYVTDGKQIKIGTNIYVETIGKEVQWYSQDAAKVKTRIMTCYDQTCTVGNYIPESFDLFDTGIYAVGNAAVGSKTRGAWQIHSTLNMLGDAYLHQVSCISDSGIQGWAVDVPGSAWYVMTTIGTLFVGDVGMDQVLNAAYASPPPGVVSEKAILIDSVVSSKVNVGTINLPVTGKYYIKQSFISQSSPSSANCGHYSMFDLDVVNFEYVPIGYTGTTCIQMSTDLKYLADTCSAVCGTCSYIQIDPCSSASGGSLSAKMYSDSACTSSSTLTSFQLGGCGLVTALGSVRFECFDTMPPP